MELMAAEQAVSPNAGPCSQWALGSVAGERQRQCDKAEDRFMAV